MENHQFGMIGIKFLPLPVLTFVSIILGKVATNANFEPEKLLEAVNTLTELNSKNYLKDGQQLGRHSLIKDEKHEVRQEILCLKTFLTW